MWIAFHAVHADIGDARPYGRERVGCEAGPSAGVVASQTVEETAPGAKRGCAGAQKTVGRKRPVAADADSRLPRIDLAAADISGRAAARTGLEALRKRWPRIGHPFAAGACDRRRIADKAAFLDFVAGIARRLDDEPGFKGAPRRRVVERAFGRLTGQPRRVRDCKPRIDSPRP